MNAFSKEVTEGGWRPESLFLSLYGLPSGISHPTEWLRSEGMTIPSENENVDKLESLGGCIKHTNSRN